MSSILLYSGYCLLLLVCELFYFKIAERFQIIDRPNQRSSHTIPTIRGGGVIFVLAVLFWSVLNGFLYPWFVTGLILIAIISFVDDLQAQPPLLRFFVHFVAFALLGYELNIQNEPLFLIVSIGILSIGAINAFNFMDGINGISGIYALVNLISLVIINTYIVEFTTISLIFFVGISVILFLYFNFRKKARCFAGDVGSITMAFIQLFLVIQLIEKSGNYGWIFLFLIFGVDSVVTILYRLRKKENIFKSHRSHLYQYLSNELGFSHLSVSLSYGLIQLIINSLLILFLMTSFWWFSFVLFLVTAFLYCIIREIVLLKVGQASFFKNAKV